MNFPEEMERHLISFKENAQYIPATNPRKQWEYLEITDNLYPPIRHGFMQYAYDSAVSFHDYARHVRRDFPYQLEMQESSHFIALGADDIVVRRGCQAHSEPRLPPLESKPCAAASRILVPQPHPRPSIS